MMGTVGTYEEVVSERVRKAAAEIGMVLETITVRVIEDLSARLGVEPASWFPPRNG